MIVLDKKLVPLIRVITPELNTYGLQEVVEDYIHDNSVPSHVEGRLAPVFHVTGRAGEHARNLLTQLNHQRISGLEFELKRGFFIDSQVEHAWCQARNVIVDLAIMQFQHYPQLQENPLVALANYSYLICDNQEDPIWQLYFEEIV